MIIKNTSNDPKQQKIKQFFKDLSTGVLDSKDQSFTLLVQNIRRRYMLDAIMCSNKERQA